ncbi:MAG TPA: cation:proton antiporter, partial [Candidatus Thermoplasmatota archaeon]|nr:cation:proton antiporter [Candidatus Thermoplasmatota archaeon]
MPDTMILAVAALLLALASAGWVAHRLRLPPALGYLLLGVVVQPVWLEAHGLPLPLFQRGAQVAILVLLFLVGLELDLRRMLDLLGRAKLTLPLDILVPLVAGFAIGILFGWSPRQAAVLAIALGTSSTLFGERLTSSPSFPPAARHRALGISVAEDVATVLLLGGLALLAPAANVAWYDPFVDLGRMLVLVALMAVGAQLLVPRVLDAIAIRHSSELVLLAGVTLVLGFGAFGAWVGSAPLGAFVAGLAASEAGSRFVLRRALLAGRDVAMAAFFFAVGLSV